MIGLSRRSRHAGYETYSEIRYSRQYVSQAIQQTAQSPAPRGFEGCTQRCVRHKMSKVGVLCGSRVNASF